MATSQPSILEALFVFNPTLGDENTEGEKILSFWPPETDLNKQKDYVGLAEALHSFTRSVSPSSFTTHLIFDHSQRILTR